jgi:hypothetical protein
MTLVGYRKKKFTSPKKTWALSGIEASVPLAWLFHDVGWLSKKNLLVRKKTWALSGIEASVPLAWHSMTLVLMAIG